MKKFLAFIAALLILVSCKTTQAPQVPEAIPPVSGEPALYAFTLLAAGDNLIHQTILDSCVADGVYNFFPVYSEVKSIIRQASLAFINQETVMGGARLGYSGYPRFNTPAAMAAAVADLGFTVVNHANNHAMDRGEAGILATLDTWDSIPGISVLGIRRSKDNAPLILKQGNITLGFLAYTYGTNGIALPNNKPWLVSMTDRKTMAAEIEALRPLCDFLVVSAHWGNEYTREPVESQISLAGFFAEHGVDLVLGHHPHVLQRVEYITRPDGKQMLCFYSLGNFVSNQERKESLLGAFAYIEITKKDKDVFVSDAGLIPVITHIESGYAKTIVFPFYAYTNKLLEQHRLFTRDKDFNMDFYNKYLAGLNTKIFDCNPFEILP